MTHVTNPSGTIENKREMKNTLSSQSNDDVLHIVNWNGVCTANKGYNHMFGMVNLC